MVVLVAAPALGHDGADEAGIDVLLDRLARHIAVALGLDRALTQLRRQGYGAHDEIGTRRNAVWRNGGASFSQTRHELPPSDVRFGRNGKLFLSAAAVFFTIEF